VCDFSSRNLEISSPPLFFLKRNIKPTSKKIFGLLCFSQKMNILFSSFLTLQPQLPECSKGSCQSFWLPEFSQKVFERVS